MSRGMLAQFARGIELLQAEDPNLYNLIVREQARQQSTLMLIAASSIADPSVLVCEGTTLSNVTTEGYPKARFHAGCQVVDEIEMLAVERAKEIFHARYANVQPHSGTSANEIVMFSLLKPGDIILGLDLNSGGHLSHGATASVSGKYFQTVTYGLTDEGYINYDEARTRACTAKPKLIICGASAYPRKIDFTRFREIADEVQAYLLADVSHVAGLIAAGEHPSPINLAHFTTTSTYKQLYGPRGGLILMGKDTDAVGPDGKHLLVEVIQRGVFPFFQGTPHLASIAAKARALAMAHTPEFRMLAQRIVVNARILAHCLIDKGYDVATAGTDNHLVLIDLARSGLTGLVAERALEECDIVVNKNRVPNDRKSAFVTSGLRLGTNVLAARGMSGEQVRTCADLVHQVLSSIDVVSDTAYTLNEEVKRSVRATVHELCDCFPLPRYPIEDVYSNL